MGIFGSSGRGYVVSVLSGFFKTACWPGAEDKAFPTANPGKMTQITTFPPFLFKATYLEPRQGVNHRRHDSDCFRLPMTILDVNERFISKSRGIYLWTGIGHCSPVNQNPTSPNAEPYLTSTIFCCDYCSSYNTLGFDCTTRNVIAQEGDDPQHNWIPLQFAYETDRGDHCIACVGHAYGSATTVANPSGAIGARGPPNWFDQQVPLLPRHCDFEGPGPSRYTGSCQLTGQLSMIIGLIAQTTSAENLSHAVAHSFRPRQQWRSHSWPVNANQSKRESHIGICSD